jgi:hypothetical protein
MFVDRPANGAKEDFCLGVLFRFIDQRSGGCDIRRRRKVCVRHFSDVIRMMASWEVVQQVIDGGKCWARDTFHDITR